MSVRGRRFEWGTRTFVMGIVNVTPDSFSGDGRHDTAEAIEHGVAQWHAGADILDVGGESTRPGSQQIDERTELARILPVVDGLRARLPDAVISIDTYKPLVAREARGAGADIVNCVWAAPDDVVTTAAELEMPICMMHNQRGTHYAGAVAEEVRAVLEQCALRAMRAGIAPERIMLDPGIGFGKTPDQNLEVLRSLDRVTSLGYPTLLGTSRKSTIGKLTGREPVERVFGTAATTALAIHAGIDVVRVHDVAEQLDVVRVADAIVRNWRPNGWTG